MGDRAIVLFKNGAQVERFAVYYHWAGREGVEIDARVTIQDHGDRLGDSYFCARWLGVACARRTGSNGVGLLSVPDDVVSLDHNALVRFSHGDAGVAIFDYGAGTLRWVQGTGYGFNEQPSPLELVPA
jgi:hypothetical protein